MQPIDPKSKTNIDAANDYDKDGKITNDQNPIREGQENSSILYDEGTPDQASYGKLKDVVNPPEEQQEYIDNDKNVDTVAED
jgi:hypothetical protein